MAAARYNIQVEEYSDLSLTITYKDSSDNPIDISTSTLEFELFDNDRSIADATNATVTLTTDGTDGQMDIDATWATLDLLDYKQGRYTLKVDGTVILYGKLQIKQLRY